MSATLEGELDLRFVSDGGLDLRFVSDGGLDLRFALVSRRVRLVAGASLGGSARSGVGA